MKYANGNGRRHYGVEAVRGIPAGAGGGDRGGAAVYDRCPGT